jgi:hypothetical protein
MARSVFPRHDIDPKKKDKEWILQAVKAAWQESGSMGTTAGFYSSRERFREYRNYAMGNQSVEKYKNYINPKDANGQIADVFQPLDFTIIPFIPKFRKIALGKINSFGHNIVATAIDQLARDDEAEYFADIRAKLELIESLKDVPGIEKMVGLEGDDPKTLEEADIKRKFSWKHIAAIEVEQGLDLLFTNNKYSKIEHRINEDVFDFGVGGVKEYFDDNGAIKIRHVKPYRFGCSYSEEDDFSDARWMWEVLKLTVETVRKESGFSDEIMEEIATLVGKGGNTEFDHHKYSKNYDDKTIEVVDFEYKTIDDLVLENGKNSFGNLMVRKAAYHKKGYKGEKKEYSSTSYEVIYTCRWIVGTDHVYSVGRMTNMKRKKKSLTSTRFSFHMFAPSQDQMRFFGVVEHMIPVADQIQLSWLKLQNLLLNIVPPGIAFDLSALENVSLGKAGEEWKPAKIIELYRQRGDYPYRSIKEDGSPSGDIPIKPIQNMVMGEVNNLMILINSFLGLLRDNIGFNEVTDGSAPDPRMLNGVANLAYQSTSQALSHLVIAKKNINEELCEDLIIRMQDAFKDGKHEGYVRALGASTKKFFETRSDISLHEIAVKIEDKPNDQEKANLEIKIQRAIDKEQITIADDVQLSTIENIKEKAAMLAYFVRKNREERQQEQMMLSQQNAKVQQESAMVTEAEKRKTIEFETGQKVILIDKKGKWDYDIKKMDVDTRQSETYTREQSRIATKEIENDGKLSNTVLQLQNKKEGEK